MSPLVVPGSHADLIRQEFKESLHKPEFWVAAARESVPVIGVFFFGWEAIYAALFFALESWLFVSTRISAETAFDPQSRAYREPKGRFGAAGHFLGYLAVALPLCAFVVGTPGFFALHTGFPEEQWEAMAAGGWLDPEILAGLAILVASEIYATWKFARRAAGRTDEERLQDDTRIKTMFHRMVVLLGCSFLLGFLVKLTPGGKAFVLIPFFVMLYFEACPREIRRTFGGNRR